MFLCKSTLTIFYVVILKCFVLGEATNDTEGLRKAGGGACITQKDCLYRGVCRVEGDSKVCSCFEGVRGDNCDIVEECVDNPAFCGTGTDVECDFDLNSRKTYCDCEGIGRRFDMEQKKCVDQKPCAKYTDCLNGGLCNEDDENRTYKKYCNCVHGTSGDFCERITECANNPSLCGNGTEVECRFNSILERAFCHCKNGTQRFDLTQKKCVDRKECRVHDECLPFGLCTEKCQAFEPCNDHSYFQGKTSCHCIEGTSGENCEIVNDCYNKELDCGESDSTFCTYHYISGFKGRAFCKCKDPNQAFDRTSKTCKSKTSVLYYAIS